MISTAHRTKRRQVKAILDLLARELPGYAELLSSPTAANVHESVSRNADQFYKHLFTGRLAEPDALEPLLRQARLRVSQGLPLEDFMAAYRLGVSVLWKTVLDSAAAAAPQVQSELLERIHLWFSHFHHLTSAVTAAYVEERETRHRSREQTLEEWFRLLLAGDLQTATLESRARTLGIPLDESSVALVFHGRLEPAALAGREEWTRILRRLPDFRCVAIERGRQQVIALAAEEPRPERLWQLGRDLPGSEIRIGVGSTGSELSGIRRSIEEAFKAVEIGAVVDPAETVLRYQDLLVYDLIGIDRPDAWELAQRVLAPLADEGPDGIYRRTLRVFCRNAFRLKPAAAALGIHPHTLTYRLEQIGKRFGIDLAEPQSRLRVQLALLILDGLQADRDRSR